MAETTSNIARHLPLMAALQPDRAAIKVPRGRTTDGRIDYLTLSFRELDLEVDAWCARLSAAGVSRGDRTLLMVRQGLPLIASAFALFKLGAAPVVIDPGMGLKSFLACVERSRPSALVGIPLAQILSHVFRSAFRSVNVRVTASGSMTKRLTKPLVADPTVSNTMRYKPVGVVADCGAGDLAAILFTSGSTGKPKGVCYQHGMFEEQVRLIREIYGIEPGEVDLPMLPVFALFNPALGMTTIVPEIDPGKPASVDPAKILQAIRQEKVTNSFGSPTLWRKIAGYCAEREEVLPGMRRVLCAGAPVPASLWADAKRLLPNGRLHSPYGATEVLPVSSVASDEVDVSSVSGACVGRPLAANKVRIIAITESPIATINDVREMPRGEVGEIIVTGPTVTREYDQLPEATALAKIQGAEAPGAREVWHRMGDAGYVDAEGRLWFCGRVVERIETLAGVMFTEPCEQVFRTLPWVARCALVGVGKRGSQVPVLVVEPNAAGKDIPRDELIRQLRERAAVHSHTKIINHFLFHPAFPVDVRHNAKIHRLTLARWAAGRM